MENHNTSSDVNTRFISETDRDFALLAKIFPPPQSPAESTDDDPTPLPQPLSFWSIPQNETEGVDTTTTSSPETSGAIGQVVEAAETPNTTEVIAIQSGRSFTSRSFSNLIVVIVSLLIGFLGAHSINPSKKTTSRSTELYATSQINQEECRHDIRSSSLMSEEKSVVVRSHSSEHVYRLGKYDYPSLLAYACGVKGKNGYEAYKTIKRINPQEKNWNRYFQEGEQFETPCELTVTMVRAARHEIKQLRRTTQGGYAWSTRSSTKDDL